MFDQRQQKPTKYHICLLFTVSESVYKPEARVK